MPPRRRQFLLGRPLVFGPGSGRRRGRDEDDGGPEAAVIFLHGHDEGPERAWPDKLWPLREAHPRWQWVHLRAPVLPQSCLGGAACPAWGNYLQNICTRVGSIDYNNP